MEAMELLANRVSSPRLRGQVPRAVIEMMVRSAGRAPDHAQLAPYRFLLIEGEARQRLGDIFVEAKEMAGESLDEQARAKLRAKPLRAPHILVGIASLSHHPKGARAGTNHHCRDRFAKLSAGRFCDGVWRHVADRRHGLRPACS